MQKQVYEFISKQTGDPIVEWRTCRISGSEFAIFQSDIIFLEKISPVFNGKKYLVPLPTLCPEERERRRLLFRNERNLYMRKCDGTGERILSVYSEGHPFPVYKYDYWMSDQWEVPSFGDAIDKGATTI